MSDKESKRQKDLRRAEHKAFRAELKKRAKKMKMLDKEARKARKINQRNKRARDM